MKKGVLYSYKHDSITTTYGRTNSIVSKKKKKPVRKEVYCFTYTKPKTKQN